MTERQKERKAKGQNDEDVRKMTEICQKDNRKMSERCQNVRITDILSD